MIINFLPFACETRSLLLMLMFGHKYCLFHFLTNEFRLQCSSALNLHGRVRISEITLTYLWGSGRSNQYSIVFIGTYIFKMSITVFWSVRHFVGYKFFSELCSIILLLFRWVYLNICTDKWYVKWFNPNVTGLQQHSKICWSRGQ